MLDSQIRDFCSTCDGGTIQDWEWDAPDLSPAINVTCMVCKSEWIETLPVGSARFIFFEEISPRI